VRLTAHCSCSDTLATMAAASLQSPLALKFIFEAYCNPHPGGPSSPGSTASRSQSTLDPSAGLMTEDAYLELVKDCPEMLDKRFTAADAKAALAAVARGHSLIDFDTFVQALHQIASLKYPAIGESASVLKGPLL
jgi:hypothetical protein